MKTRDWLLFGFLGIVWGTSFLWIKIAVTEVSPLVLVGFRTLIAAAGVGVFIFLDRKTKVAWPEVRARLGIFFILGLINISMPFLLISWAEKTIDSGMASILNATMPLFTIVISPLFVNDDRINLPKALGLLAGFIGVVILFYPSVQGGWSDHLVGQLAMLAAALCYASGTVYARKKAHGLPPQMQAFLQLSMSTLIIWSLAFVIERPITLPQLPVTWLALAWLGLLGTGLAYIIYFYLLPRIGPTRMSMVTYIPPLVGMILGIVVLGEVFYWQSLLGALLILSGITIVNYQPKSKIPADQSG